MIPKNIFESPDVIKYLQTRQIYDQYIKAKKFLSDGHIQKFDFKLRQPKEDGVFQFRINQKYRAFGYFSGGDFFVYKISDHQE